MCPSDEDNRNNAAVLRATLRIIAVGHALRASPCHDLEPSRSNTLVYEALANSLGALCRENHVLLLCARFVSMSLDRGFETAVPA